MQWRGGVVAVVVAFALAEAARAQESLAAELAQAERLAWAKRFDEAEARYHAILARHPKSRAARLGLARTVLWNGKYAEASARFDELLRENPNDAEVIEGRATAAYWSGDLRTAAREFRRIPDRDFARQSLREIASAMTPSQRVHAVVQHDDQPLEAARGEVVATFFSDPLTRWSAAAGTYHLDSDRRGTGRGEFARIENETSFPAMRITIGGSAGIFEHPDGTRRPIGSASVRYRELTLRVDHREELAAAPALATHASSTTATLRWSRETPGAILAAEASHRRYFDDNSGRAFVAWAVAPVLRRERWTLWSGLSGALRDTDESRFGATAVSSTLDPSGLFFHYRYRGEYAPYWTPDDLSEARAVLALERTFARGRVKMHFDGGVARDRGRAFGPNAGRAPFPTAIETFAFTRDYRPYRTGIAGELRVTRELRLEVGFERAVTVDYRSTSVHAAVVRRR